MGTATTVSHRVLLSSSPTRGRKTSALMVGQPVSNPTATTNPNGNSASNENSSANATIGNAGRLRSGRRPVFFPSDKLRTDIATSLPQDQSRPACVISSMTFLLFSEEGSTFGASRSFSGVSFGLEAASTPTAYSKALLVRSASCPCLPVIHLIKACACALCLLEASTPPPEMLTKAPGSGV